MGLKVVGGLLDFWDVGVVCLGAAVVEDFGSDEGGVSVLKRMRVSGLKGLLV